MRSSKGSTASISFPPLGPEPAAQGAFEATLLDGLSVAIEAEDAAGQVTALATFDQTTTPRVALLAEHERYWVNIPAATYVTDPAKTYRVRVLLDGNELGTSVLSPRIFDVLAWNPDLPLGVQVRIEGSGAVRAVARARLHGSAPAHCSDGVRNKDETGVDCGGGCAPCPTCSDGIRNQHELGVDCGGECPVDLPTSATPLVLPYGSCYGGCCAGYVQAVDYWQPGSRVAGDTTHYSTPADACNHSSINQVSNNCSWTSVIGVQYETDIRWACIYVYHARQACGYLDRDYGPYVGGDYAHGHVVCQGCPAGSTMTSTNPTVCSCPAGTGWDTALQRCRAFCSR